jgi:phosphatidylserine/phosphatidylglycerophosphate/cardiolipin synthase-like enzyme
MRIRKTLALLSAAILGLLVVWSGANLLLQVQFPPRPEQRGTRVPPGGTDPLYAAWKHLPALEIDGTPVALLDDNGAAWAARWRLLAGANDRLDISYFILEQDIFGVSFLGHLLHKADQGVRVRVLLDAIGTEMSRDLRGNDYLDTLVNTDRVDVKMYRPLFYRYLDAFLTLNPAALIASEHDKILLADGVIGLTGGRNISAEYFVDPARMPESFLDTDVLLHGKFVERAMENAFDAQFSSGEAHAVRREEVNLHESRRDLELAYHAMDAWLRDQPIPEGVSRGITERELPWLEELRSYPHLRGILRQPTPPVLEAPVRLLDSRTRLVKSDDEISNSLVLLARSAQKSIFIQSPYLVLPREAADELIGAARRGVRITAVVNGPTSSKSATSQAIFMEQWPLLLAEASGMRLFVAADRHSLHTKAITFDDRLTLVGTYNLDPLSMATNSELMAAVWSEDFAGRVTKTARALIAEGVDRTVRYRIARDREDMPLRDQDGHPIVAFGPEQHSDPAQWPAVARWRTVARVLIALPGIEPLF